MIPVAWRYPYPRGKKSRLYRDYQRLAAPILEQCTSGPRPIIQVTSAWDQEGKTYTTLNLAAHLALRGQRALVIDADPGRASISRRFDCCAAPGFLNLVQGSTEPDFSAVPGLPNLQVLALGNAEESEAEELLLQGLQSTLVLVADGYDCVLVDSGPLLGGEDARALCSQVTAVLLVVRAHRTSDRDITQSLEVLAERNAPIKAVVFNAYREYLPQFLRSVL